MLIRLQTNVGIWRIELPDPSMATVKVSDILQSIAQTRPNVVYETSLCFDPAYKRALEHHSSLKTLGITHGSMLYCRVDPSTCASILPSSTNTTTTVMDTTNAAASTTTSTSSGHHTKRIIAADGTIQLVHDPNAAASSDEDKGFRKGLLPLRDMKMQWTLRDFMDLDSRFVYKIKRQDERWIGTGGVSLDTANAHEFQLYLRKFNFQRSRMGFLYGRFVSEKIENIDSKIGSSTTKNQKVIVEAIYEPRQEIDADSPEGFVLLDNTNDEDGTDFQSNSSYDSHVDTIASYLGLQKVGWIYGHKPREPGFHMSAAEIIMAAELQLEAAEGVNPTPFVTIKVTLGENEQTSFEAFQVSLQAMEMVAEGALEVYPPDPKLCLVNETFTAIKEGKECKTVEGEFFLTVVPIAQHASEVFVCEFPKLNREFDDRHPSHDEMKKQLSKSGSSGWTFVDLLADFNLLVYLCDYLDVKADMVKVCTSIVDREIPLDEGYRLIIGALAKLDHAY